MQRVGGRRRCAGPAGVPCMEAGRRRIQKRAGGGNRRLRGCGNGGGLQMFPPWRRPSQTSPLSAPPPPARSRLAAAPAGLQAAAGRAAAGRWAGRAPETSRLGCAARRAPRRMVHWLQMRVLSALQARWAAGGRRCGRHAIRGSPLRCMGCWRAPLKLRTLLRADRAAGVTIAADAMSLRVWWLQASSHKLSTLPVHARRRLMACLAVHRACTASGGIGGSRQRGLHACGCRSCNH